MTTDNRAAIWLLSPIALQILDYLDDGDDAYAFLQAAPDGSLDDALDALRTLLAMDSELPLWPTAHIANLDKAYSMSPGVVTRALPAFKKITVACSQDCPSICHNTVLPPTTAVRSSVRDDVTSVRAALGKWLPNLVDFRIVSPSSVDFSAVVKDSLSSCPSLCSLTMDQQEVFTQDAFDAALTAVVATCRHVERISISSSKISHMSDWRSLLTWLAQPTARHLELDSTDFPGALGTDLAAAMIVSNTLETIELLHMPSLTRAVTSPSSPPLLEQLRHLVIWDYIPEDDYDTYDDDDDDIIPPPAFDEADMASLARKLATSRLESLDLMLRVACDATSVLFILLEVPTLTKFALQEANLTAFPPLMQLLHLELSSVTFSDEAIASLAALLRSSPKLVQLDLGNDELPISQADTIFCALPQWLSRRGTTCGVYLAIKSDACANAFATALAQAHNAHKVKITVSAYGLSLAAKALVVTALASTARIALVFSGPQDPKIDAALEACGRQHHLTIVYRKEYPQTARQTWFHSPRNALTTY
ncbi:hypothetical protein SDRG_02217 [Saprolegnia diclina VS20]|uniref:Uncharacterized protein n=1 Tax=Saprolegnia diclina (strain VS20) TaxID=1156394 RepID=T0R1U2_SAPDV|nr:hypothetical protein SDRG_02217 [Saprolegnia diclina VS20]EQC40315.1 hypothetical protein SDRG_02217 [Saprolegnia diclina VS20]|eukprot:XP_008606014.1 hypothetical protein SDRG_02217 [Saprolegnia diclina VS20]